LTVAYLLTGVTESDQNIKRTKIWWSVIISRIQLFSTICKLYGSMPWRQCEPIWIHFHTRRFYDFTGKTTVLNMVTLTPTLDNRSLRVHHCLFVTLMLCVLT